MYWIIDDDGGASVEKFRTLRAVKNHFSFYSKKDLENLDGVAIYKVDSRENVLSVYFFHYYPKRKQKLVFSRSRKK